MSKYQFVVVVNDVETYIKIPATKKAIQDYIRRYITSRYTHMGQLVKKSYGYDYNTTIGKYYNFVKERINQ
jgi:hypothetical protein